MSLSWACDGGFQDDSGEMSVPRVAPWSYFTRSLRDCLSGLSQVIGTSTFFMVTMQDGFLTLARLYSRADTADQKLSSLRLSELSGLDILLSMQPVAISDTNADPRGAALAAIRIGAYMGAPIILKDGTLYGTLCTADERVYESSKSELQALKLTANMVAYIIDLERTAVHDPLTGALNRLFLERHNQTLQTEFGDSFALVYIDLDDFKSINDEYGHEYGDAVLRVIVQRLKRRIRMEDVVVRVGGDEFIVVLTGITNDEMALSRTVSRLHKSIDVEYSIHSKTFRVSASLGVSLYPQNGDDFDTLVKAADQAMYQVKHAGGKGFAVHDGAQTGGRARLWPVRPGREALEAAGPPVPSDQLADGRKC